jgi:hypothetical protein
LESKGIEELYSFKAMLRMLYQAGVVILREVSIVPSIPFLSFSSSWIQFTGSLQQAQKKVTEEASLIELAECLILFEEFIKSMKILVTSRKPPLMHPTLLMERDLMMTTAPSVCNLKKRVTPAPV